MSVDTTAVARVLGITTDYKDLRGGAVAFLPQRIYVMAQGNSAAVFTTTKFRATSAGAVGAIAGYGSPAHAIARQLFPDNGDGVGTVPVTFALLEDGYEATPATGRITPTGTQTKASTYRVVVNNVKSTPFVVLTTDTVALICDKIVAAVNGVLDMPVIATDNTTYVAIVSKWAGLSANACKIAVDGTAYGVTYTLIQPVGGLVNPTLDDALAQIGAVWESMLLNALNISDDTALDTIQAYGEGRWGTLVRKPLICFTGNNIADVSAATAVSAARTDDRVNAQLVAPGSLNLPHVIAARQLARIASVANNNPPTDYAGQRADGITPGTDGEQWDYAERDLAVKAGSSTIEVSAGVVELSDTVTFYAPTGEVLPPYRWVSDIVRLQNIIFNLALIFESQEWKAAPLIPDAQVNANPLARKPKNAKAAVCAMHDSLGLNAIISDPAFAKANTFVTIDTQNPRRINVVTTVKLSGNTGIVDVGLNFGFYLGTPVVLG